MDIDEKSRRWSAAADAARLVVHRYVIGNDYIDRRPETAAVAARDWLEEAAAQAGIGLNEFAGAVLGQLFSNHDIKRDTYGMNRTMYSGIPKMLLDCGADPNLLIYNGYGGQEGATLHAVMKTGAKSVFISDILSLLKSYGADPNLKDGCGRPPIFYSLWDSRALKKLCGIGADPLATDARGETALFEVYRGRRTFKYPQARPEDYIETELAGLGVDVNARNANGETALFYAAYDAQGVRTLLKLGADVNVRNAKGYGIAAVVAEEYLNRKISGDTCKTILGDLAAAGLDISDPNAYGFYMTLPDEYISKLPPRHAAEILKCRKMLAGICGEEETADVEF